MEAHRPNIFSCVPLDERITGYSWHIDSRLAFGFRIDVLEALVSLQDYSGKFLPDALREFFSHIPAPRERGQFLETLLDRFSKRYVETNPQAGLLKGTCTKLVCLLICVCDCVYGGFVGVVCERKESVSMKG